MDSYKRPLEKMSKQSSFGHKEFIFILFILFILGVIIVRSMFNLETKNSLNIILISDPHNEISKLERMKPVFDGISDFAPDYIFLLGDFDNIPRREPSQLELNQNEEGTEESRERIKNMIFKLEVFGCPIVYVPGNHDPSEMFIATSGFLPVISQRATNVHNNYYTIAEGLGVYGIGGSIPAYYTSHSDNKAWEGFPYKNDQELSDTVQEKIISNYESITGNQTILLSHVGPDVSSTTIDYRNPERPVFSGSNTISNYLKKNNVNILANFHGHTHAGKGQSTYNNITIVNPGALKDGNFALVRLTRRSLPENSKWTIQSIRFVDLNTFA